MYFNVILFLLYFVIKEIALVSIRDLSHNIRNIKKSFKR